MQPAPPDDPELNAGTPPVEADVTPETGDFVPSDSRWISVVIRGLMAVAAVLLLVVAGARIAVLTDPGRNFVVALVEGLPLGPVGRLHLEGLHGDLFGRFSVARLQVIDRTGVWLDGRELSLHWAPEELAARRLRIRSLDAGKITVLRQPVITASTSGGPAQLPVSIIIDRAHIQLETRPQATVVAGLWDIGGHLHVRRTAGFEGLLRATSRLRRGDGMAASFRIGDPDRLELKAEAVEAAGGALAGAAGLPVNQPFSIRADLAGVSSAAKLRVVTRSGDQTPLLLEASWGKDGATVDARARLGDSRHTEMFAKRIGPTAHLLVATRRQAGDRYLADVRLVGDFATLNARGPVNMKTRRAEAMDVSVAVDELAKWWVPVPHIGPTRTRGVLTGDIDRFVYKGDGLSEKIEQNGYTIARMSGPLTFTHERGEFRLVSDLKGEGGGGTESLLWTLLGASPVVHLDGGRIRDGRYLFHALKVNGSHLQLDGQGGWTLFGALAFKGRAVIEGIGLGRAGKGTLTGEWDAIEPRGHEDWELKAQARGHELVTGAAEFDRLMGLSPAVTTRARWTARGLEVEHFTVNGQAINADLRGLLDREGLLAMDMDWSATGPFGVGGVEIAGAAHGVGKVSGNVLTPRADLTAELTSIDAGRLVVKPAKLLLTFIKADHEVDGAVAIEGPSNFGQASGKAAFRFTDDAFEMHDIAADAGGLNVSGALTLRNGLATAADLQLKATTGAFLTNGRITGAVRLTGRGEQATAVIALDGVNVQFPGMAGVIRKARLNARGPLEKLPFDVLADSNDPVAWKFQGSGVFTHPARPEITLIGGGRVRRADFKLLEPAVIRWSEADHAVKGRASISGGEVEFDGAAVGNRLDGHARITRVNLQGLTDDYIGLVSGTVSASGVGPHLLGRLDGQLENARSRDAPADQALSASLAVTLADTRMHVAANAGNNKGLKADIDLDLPSEASAYPFRIAIDRTKPVAGRFNADGELRSLWDLLAGGDRSLGGQIAAHGALSGPLEHLRATGDAALTAGTFRDAATGLTLRDLTVSAAFNSDEVIVRQFTGSDGQKGSLSGDGRVSLSADGASTLKLTLSKFRLIDNEIGRAQASGAVTVTRDTTGHAKLAGALTVDRADIAANPLTPTGVVPLVVREVHMAPREGEDAPQPRASPLQVAFDVTIRAARGIFVRGKGLDVELSLDSHVSGDSLKPDLTGAARLIRGSYDFSGKRFDFDELGTVRLGPTPETIRLDLTAHRQDPSLTAQIQVRGTAAKPEINLTSTPVLPQDEILSRVLFGVAASQLSGFEAAQLASALTSLATGGGFDVIGGLRQFARLDRLSVGVDQSTVNVPGVKQATTISGGKYLTDNVYLELTGGGRTGPSAQVEVRLQRNLSVISQVGSQGDARLSVRFRQNY